MRRAPAKSRKYLKDAALIAMDDRIAAEILLRFYEDLALRGQAEPLPDLSGALGWHPLHERLSNHPDTLDEDLDGPGHLPSSARRAGARRRDRGVPRAARLATLGSRGAGTHAAAQTRQCRPGPAEGGRLERRAIWSAGRPPGPTPGQLIRPSRASSWRLIRTSRSTRPRT